MGKKKIKGKKKREINKSNFFFKKSKNLCESTKPLLQSRAHGDGDQPLLPLLVCKGWTPRDSPLPIAFHVAFPFRLSPPFFFHLVLIFLFPPFLVVPVLLFSLFLSSLFCCSYSPLIFSSSTASHTHNLRHTKNKKKTKRPQKPQIKRNKKKSQKPQTKPHKTENRKKKQRKKEGKPKKEEVPKQEGEIMSG